MKRILQIVGRMGYGGIETFLMNIYRNIDRTKVQFDFAVTKGKSGEYEEEIKTLGGKIYYFPERKNIKEYKKKWYDFFREHKEFECVHMHVSSLSNIIPIKAASANKIKKRYIHSHNTYQQGILHNILNQTNKINLNRYATELFACSQEAGKYSFGNKKFEIIKNGIDAKQYEFDKAKREKIRNKFKILDNQIAFLHIGRFTYQKNHEFLIDVFSEIIKIKPNSLLYLIGEGELEGQVKEKVKKLEIGDNVIFLGTQKDISEIMQGMDAFIFPSLYEGLGIVAIEAQAAGLKVFASDTIPEEVKITELVSFISLKKSKQEWAYNILKNLEKEKLRKKNYEQIKNSGYDIKYTTEKLENYYEMEECENLE